MIDLHCHMLPGLDDGPCNLEISLEMARMAVADGIILVACTPHICPGLYHNTSAGILAATYCLRDSLRRSGIALDLVCGADAHMDVHFTQKLAKREIPTLAKSRYVLVEPPYHVAPTRMEQFFFKILLAGYIPILTHPERLRWIAERYRTIERLSRYGVWMQITASSLTGNFGREPRYWAERMLDEGHIHILATDAHDTHRRPPDLSKGWEAAARRAGEGEATHMVLTRPRGVIENEPPSNLPLPFGQQSPAVPDMA
jgi:protein-tyrosine phosphatase